jgi:hypothetical protein
MTRTNAYTVFVVLLRAAALWLACGSLLTLPSLLVRPGDFSGMQDGVWIPLAGVGGLVLLAALVWVFADKLARLVMARPQQPVFESDLPIEQWQMLAFSVVGVWQLVLGLGDLVYFAVRAFVVLRLVPDSGPFELPPDNLASVVASVAQVGIGLVLVVGNGSLVHMLRRWRQAGAQ